ncbi:hypothetical protein MA16_Dca021436 [Dendrobium catenatum]|uniref:Uncharacterized protein n=1 Tax=Dendrobium catenatum TaxID=906689 RepID=A0A2I0WE52_9ASPA|nr:hypothetical protein MA16_Dca021436 [Dendrobium catenatum]
MAVDVRWHLPTGGTLEDRRSVSKVMNGSSCPMLSPSAFDDGKTGFNLFNKSKGNKGIVIKEDGFVAKREHEVIGKRKSIIIEGDVKKNFKGRVELIPFEGSDASSSSKQL